MKSSIGMGNLASRPRLRSSLFAGFMILALAAFALPVLAADGELSKEDKACLKCHDKEGETTTLGNGDKLSIHISTKAYLDSRHNETSCEDCHADIDAKTHGKGQSTLKSKRDLALSMRESCRTCHKKKTTEYDDSVHAAMIKEGSTKAPLCSDCHNPHTQQSVKIVQPLAATPCAKCHEDIFKAYSADVHGQERAARGKAAPLCADCHQAHAVKAASLGEGVKDACLACHKDAVDLHKDWLPNTGLHFEAISCPACHAPNAQRRVNLRLYDGAAKRQVLEKTGVPKFERLADAADVKDMGLDERALWSLLKEFNQEGTSGKTVLRGRLEVRSGVEAHQISEKSKAVRDCNTCHQSGAAPFQSVTLTIAGPDGRPLRHGIQKEVLNSLTSMESVRGFYAIGGTRIKLLDDLLLLVVVGALCVPLGHMVMKWMFRKVRAKVEAEKLAAAAPAGGPPASGANGSDSDPSRKQESSMFKLYINPLPVRIWHWTNALGFMLLIATGLQIRYTGSIQVTSFKTAVTLHNWAGWVVIANFFIWLLFYLFSDKIKVYHPELSPTRYFKESFRQMQFYGYGIFRGEANPHHPSVYHKFNPLQSMLYQIIMMLLVPIQFFTGVLLWDVKRFSGMVEMMGGLRVVDTVHVLLFIFFSGFIIVHIYLASLGHTPTAHFKAMITGYEEVEEEPKPGPAP